MSASLFLRKWNSVVSELRLSTAAGRQVLGMNCEVIVCRNQVIKTI